MLSPGYSYAKAPDQEHFLRRQKTHELFAKMLGQPEKRWKFNQSPIFLQFLMGKRDFECTPWGMPAYNIFGWQRPCYLLQEGYAASFQDLMENTRWEDYGRRSGNEKCQDCMVHCGYETSAVDFTFSSWRGLRETVRHPRQALMTPPPRRGGRGAARRCEPLPRGLEPGDPRRRHARRGHRAGVRLSRRRHHRDVATAPTASATSTTATPTVAGPSSRSSRGGAAIRRPSPTRRSRASRFTGRDTAAGNSYAAWLKRKRGRPGGRRLRTPPGRVSRILVVTAVDVEARGLARHLGLDPVPGSSGRAIRRKPRARRGRRWPRARCPSASTIWPHPPWSSLPAPAARSPPISTMVTS